jgi:hypothetical protein
MIAGTISNFADVDLWTAEWLLWLAAICHWYAVNLYSQQPIEALSE